MAVSNQREVDRLYQLPLGEFTSARNELARRTSDVETRAAIRALEKPTAPAWAVNQLYWRKRRVFDRLLETARRLRVEHGRRLSGKGAEIEEAERAHRQALKAAADEIRGLMADAGQTPTSAVMNAVTETLQALPGRDDHGRLVKPLRPLGFEALAGLMTRGGSTLARLAEVKPVAPAKAPSPSHVASPRESAEARARVRRERRKALEAAERGARNARQAERAARAEFARCEMSLARVQRERTSLQDRVDSLTSQRDQLALALEQHRRAVDRATTERERLDAVLRAIKS